MFKSQPSIFVDDTKFDSNTKEYYSLLNVLITGNYKKLPALFNCKFPLKYKEYYDEDNIYFDEFDEKI